MQLCSITNMKKKYEGDSSVTIVWETDVPGNRLPSLIHMHDLIGIHSCSITRGSFWAIKQLLQRCTSTNLPMSIKEIIFFRILNCGLGVKYWGDVKFKDWITRERVWELLDRDTVVPGTQHGLIENISCMLMYLHIWQEYWLVTQCRQEKDCILA